MFDGDRSRRVALFALITAAHFLLIVWLITQSPAKRDSATSGESLISISLSPGDSASPSPKKLVERPRVAAPAPLPPARLPMPSLSSAAPETAGTAGVQGGGSACQLSDDAAAAIQQDPAAMAELAALPLGVRSEADAVMLWNGVWFDQLLPAGTPAAMVVVKEGLHLAIARMITAAPAPCRDEAIIGPVFIPIPERERTTMLAVGSGVWRWSDLLPKPSICLVADQAECPETLAPQ